MFGTILFSSVLAIGHKEMSTKERSVRCLLKENLFLLDNFMKIGILSSRVFSIDSCAVVRVASPKKHLVLRNQLFD